MRREQHVAIDGWQALAVGKAQHDAAAHRIAGQLDPSFGIRSPDRGYNIRDVVFILPDICNIAGRTVGCAMTAKIERDHIGARVLPKP